MTVCNNIVVAGLVFHLAVAVCHAQAIGERSRLSVKEVDVGNGKTAYYASISLDQFDVRVITPSFRAFDGNAGLSGANLDRAARGFFLRDYMRLSGAIAVLSGGYMRSYSPPTALGLVKSDGVLVSLPHHSWLTEALFCTDVRRASIRLITDSDAPSEFRDCVQAGPMILQNAEPWMTERSRGFHKLAGSVQEQAFVCLDRARHVVFGVTDKINFAALVELLKAIGCVDAMRLTGLDTAGLRVDRKLFGNDDYLFPNCLGAIPRGRAKSTVD